MCPSLVDLLQIPSVADSNILVVHRNGKNKVPNKPGPVFLRFNSTSFRDQVKAAKKRSGAIFAPQFSSKLTNNQIFVNGFYPTEVANLLTKIRIATENRNYVRIRKGHIFVKKCEDCDGCLFFEIKPFFTKLRPFEDLVSKLYYCGRNHACCVIRFFRLPPEWRIKLFHFRLSRSKTIFTTIRECTDLFILMNPFKMLLTENECFMILILCAYGGKRRSFTSVQMITIMLVKQAFPYSQSVRHIDVLLILVVLRIARNEEGHQ